MDVTWFGHGCFRLRGRNAAVVTDPFPPSLGPKLPRLDAEVITVSHPHENHNYLDAATKNAYVIDGPGEYEVGGLTVTGVPTFHDNRSGADHGHNTVFVIEVDDVRICHLGDLGHRLGDHELGAIGTVDVVLVPVGGGTSLAAPLAAEVVRQIEPRVVIPMHFATPGIGLNLEPADRFLKEMGVTEASPQPKLTISSSGGAGEGETKLVLLEPR